MYSASRGRAKPASSLTPSQSIRKRTRRACEPCRKRKRRCDGKEPQCSSCVEWEYECYYASDARAEPREQFQQGKRPDKLADPPQPNPPLSATSTGGDASTNFPQVVASSVAGRALLPYRSYGCNVGVTLSDDDNSVSFEAMRTVMTFDEARTLCQVYLDDCNSLFPAVETDEFLSQLAKVWGGEESQPSAAFEVSASFVVLLGAYLLKPQRSSQENAVFLHAQSLLDRISFPQKPGDFDLWLLRAWILRTLFLRFSGTLDASWLSSCTCLHIAEYIGLFNRQDPVGAQQTDPNTTSESKDLLHLAWILNRLLSLENARMPVYVPPEALTTAAFPSSPSAAILAQMMLQIPVLEMGKPGIALKSCIMQLCRYSQEATNGDARLLTLGALLICGLYRQLYQSDVGIEQDMSAAIKDSFDAAMKAANSLLASGRPWFMLATVPSQVLCICLALGRPLLTEILPEASTLLAKVYEKFRTDIVLETGNVARQLMEVCLRAREDDTKAVQKSLRLLTFRGDSSSSGVESEEDWTRFLNQQALGS